MLDTTNSFALGPAGPAPTQPSSSTAAPPSAAAAPRVPNSSPARIEHVHLTSITIDLNPQGAPQYWGHFKRRDEPRGPGSRPTGVSSVTRVATRFFEDHKLRTGPQTPSFPVYVRVPAKGRISTGTIFRDCGEIGSKIDEYLMDGLSSRNLHKRRPASRGAGTVKRDRSRSRSRSTSTSGGSSSGPSKKRTHV